MDKLQKCAVSFMNLFGKEYHIIAGSKNKLIQLDLVFEKKHFYHLVGLEKLSDIQKIRGNVCKIFDKIIQGKITYEDIEKSVFFNEMYSRLDYFDILEKILDSEEVLIRFNKNSKKSSVDAEYIIYTEIDNKIVHYFVSKDENNKYFGRSFFIRTDKNYIFQQQRFSVLKKIKKTNNEIEILTNKPIKNNA